MNYYCERLPLMSFKWKNDFHNFTKVSRQNQFIKGLN